MKIQVATLITLVLAISAALVVVTEVPNPSLDDLRSEYASDSSQFIKLKNTDLHYTDEGTGPVVLLIHGSFSSFLEWDGWVDLLAENYRVVRLDLPGFGLTGPVETEDYSVEHDMVLIDELMDNLDIERFALAGTSFGGMVSFRYASSRPEKISALILASSAGLVFAQVTESPPPSILRSLLKDYFIPRSWFDWAIHHSAGKDEMITDEHITEAYRMTNGKGRQDSARLRREAYDIGNPKDVLARISAPTLIMWGEANPALSPDVANQFQSNLTNAKETDVIVYPGVGHKILLEAPTKTARDAEQFLNRVLVSQPSS
jgi:pimeloyl-ACP methyl ester carboxylesterase